MRFFSDFMNRQFRNISILLCDLEIRLQIAKMVIRRSKSPLTLVRKALQYPLEFIPTRKLRRDNGYSNI